MQLDLEQHRTLIQSLMKSDSLVSSETTPQLIETHISSVIITADLVYKFKKPVNLGFLDFSTLEKRRHFCQEELRLNKRLSPELYLDVLPVYGSPQNPTFKASGEVLDFLVRMKPFPQQAQLDRLLDKNLLTAGQMKQLAVYIADFHQSAAKALPGDNYGKVSRINKPVEQNFIQIRGLMDDESLLKRLSVLELWSIDELDKRQSLFEQRKHQGFIRECHGDLHLRNLAWVNDKPLAFDCIEFEPYLYWIDVMSDVAFLVMDLMSRQEHELAQIFLNQYLEQTGDYQGLGVLRYYLVYRAMVRAKIEAITLTQPGISKPDQQEASVLLERYLGLAEHLIKQQSPCLILMHGPSASGKSTVGRMLSARLPAIVLRSDVERKRLFGLSADQAAGDNYQQGIYTPQATQKTYEKLAELSKLVLESGYSVIVDATFSDPAQRRIFNQLAKQDDGCFIIVDLKVSESVLKQRLLQRTGDASDADVHVLEQQLASWRELEEQERAYAVTLQADGPVEPNSLVEQIRQRQRDH